MSRDVVGVLESFAEFAKTAAPECEKYMLFVKRYAYMFLRLYLGKIMDKMGSKPEIESARYRKDLRRQLRRVAGAARKSPGLFRGINISFRNRVALWLFAHGCVESAARALVFKDAKI